MSQDSDQLKLLSIFHYVVGGITAFFACIPLIHVAMGIALISGAFDMPDAKQGPPREIGWFFVVFGSTFVLVGWTVAICILMAGRRLAQRRSRTFCLVVAGIECMIMPFGTVLGVFTIVVLMRESVARLFAGGPAGDAPQTPVGGTTFG